MRNNLFIVFGLLVVLFSLSVVSALDVGYVVRTPSNMDSNEDAVKAFLDSKGHNTVVLDDVSFDEAVYDLIVVSESVTDIGSIFEHQNKPTLFMGNSAAKKKGLASSSGSSSGRYVTVEQVDSDITEGYSLGDVEVYTTQSDIDYLLGCFPINSDSLVSKSDTTRSVILKLDTDSLLLDSGCTDRDIEIFEKNLFFGLVEASNWNSAAEDLFLDSVDWLTKSNDNDGDGYDGNLDCNDDDANINPGETEIAYNGVDDDCSGGDLTDVDNDGYDSTSVGGDDCNDDDATINPGSSDPEKNCVNSVPVIDDYAPSDLVLELIENVDQEFSVSYSDSDNLEEVTVTWKLDGQIDGFDSTYVFHADQGDYVLKAIVSDGFSEAEQEWTINVKDSSNFTCSENNGHICSSDQVCDGSLIDSSDSSSCCNISCTDKDPDFNDANTCSVTENDIEIDFLNVDSNDEFDVDENIDFSVRVRNHLNEDKEFDVEAFFYDLTEDDVIERIKESVDIDEDESKTVAFEFEKEIDLEEDNSYAILVVVDDGECNQDYVKVDVERKEDNVIIDDVKLSNDNLVCGDLLSVDVDIKNIGRSEEDVIITVKNNKLKINGKSEGIELEEYGGEDSENEKFNFALPENAKAGEYTIRTEINFGNKRTYQNNIITLAECGNGALVSEDNSNSVISLGGSNEGSESNVEELGGIKLGGTTEEVLGENANESGENKEEDLEGNGGSSLIRTIFLVALIVFAGVAGFIVYNYWYN